MTDEQATALGKRLVACKDFRPMRGMLDMQGRTWDQSLLWRWSNDVDVPDLRDPATLGCVLAMVRSVYTEPRLAVVPWRRQWAVDYVWLRDGRVSTAPTEAEALVAALEAAP